MNKEVREKTTKPTKRNGDETVDIKELKGKLTKISQFIQEENDGLQELTRKRSEVEKDADEVGNIVYSLRDKITEIDKVVADEASRINSFKSSKGQENTVSFICRFSPQFVQNISSVAIIEPQLVQITSGSSGVEVLNQLCNI